MEWKVHWSFPTDILTTILFRFIWKILDLGSNGIEICRFLIVSLLFSKKELKNTSNFSIIFKQKSISNKVTPILIRITVFCLLINIWYFKNLDDRKQHIEAIKTIYGFFKNAKNHSIVFQLWLNDHVIILENAIGCGNDIIDQGRSYHNLNIDISLCFFSRISLYIGDGGVIYISGGSYSMNIDFSMFYNCVCSILGGAIFFDSTNSSLRMICANSCSATNYLFSYLRATQVNQAEYLSVTKCSHTTSKYYSIYIESGNQRIDNTNSSMNNAREVSGIFIYVPSSFTSSYCTFSNNKVSDGICIYFYTGTGTISMSNANIIHNNSPSWYGVVSVEGAGLRNMMYCIFLDNQNNLFCISSGSLEVSHSFIDHSGKFSTSKAVSTPNNNSFTNTNTYQLQFFNSLHCNADDPLPQRTPDLTQTPMITPEKTPLNTLNESPIITLEETPLNTLNESPINTLEETPLNTLNESPINTPEETPLNTLNESPINTHEDTPMNYNSSTNSLRLLLVSLSIIVLLISIVYSLGLILNSKQESSSISSSKSDGNILSTI